MADQTQAATEKGAPATAFYLKVIAVVQPFLGAQAEQFVLRQISHIRVTPEQLAPDHIPAIAGWIENSARLIMRREQARDLCQKILELAK